MPALASSLACPKSWPTSTPPSLAPVILSPVSLLIDLQCLSQSIASALLDFGHTHMASAGTLISPCCGHHIHNKRIHCAPSTLSSHSSLLTSLRAASFHLTLVWSNQRGGPIRDVRTGLRFCVKSAREGGKNLGDVTAVFQAGLVVSSNLEMCIPQVIVAAKRKEVMPSLFSLIPPTSFSPLPSSANKNTGRN